MLRNLTGKYQMPDCNCLMFTVGGFSVKKWTNYELICTVYIKSNLQLCQIIPTSMNLKFQSIKNTATNKLLPFDLKWAEYLEF